jgi:hypothetical protein
MPLHPTKPTRNMHCPPQLSIYLAGIAAARELDAQMT